MKHKEMYEEGTMKFGIDTIAMYTPRYALTLETLANERHIASDKYANGLGQYIMSVPPPGEDIVTMGANAAKQAIKDINKNDIEMVLFATESGIDQSKAAGIYIHGLLGLPERCRVVELKQACYSGTMALQLAMTFLQANPSKKVLVVASDIARYTLHTAAESSQGAAAIAMVLSAAPRILAFESEYGLVTENVMDFWRPNYMHEALVEGKYSSKLYLTLLEKTWQQYAALSGRDFTDHAYFCYHVPVPKLVEKAHNALLKITGYDHLAEEVATSQIEYGLTYGRNIGNSYTAALYVALASLLDLAPEDLTDKRVGFYSYGSGCVAEYFSGVVQPGYQAVLNTAYHEELLSSRQLLTYNEFADFYHYAYPEDGSEKVIPEYNTGDFRLAKFEMHKRIYLPVKSLSDKKQYDVRESQGFNEEALTTV